MKKNNFPGKFIVFEGIDGSGQTTQTELLKDYLLREGVEAIQTKEPTYKSEPGKEARRMLNKEVNFDSRKIQELLTEDRKYHLETTIIPALKEGKVVVCDRYFFSTFAYGAASGVDLEWLIDINKDYLYPDLTFLLRVRPEVSIQRIKERGEKISVFEEKEKLEKIWHFYKNFPERFDGIHLIDGEKTIPKVFDQVKKIINKKILK